MSSTLKRSILVIDDDPKVREMIYTFFTLKYKDVICVMAADSQQAILKMTNQDFDIVLVDNLMPGKNGIDFAINLKNSLKYAEVEIILMSGSFQQVDVLKAMSAGIKDIIVKPFSLIQLSEKVSKSLAKIRATKA